MSAAAPEAKLIAVAPARIPEDLARPSVSEFDAAVLQFQGAYEELNDAMSGLGLFPQAVPAIENGVDIVAFSGVLRDSWMDAAELHAEEMRQLSLHSTPLPDEGISSWTATEWSSWLKVNEEDLVRRFHEATDILRAQIPLQATRRLHALFKGFTFLLRAYQDQLATVILEYFGGRAGKAGKSMANVLKKDNEATLWIAATVPGYTAWFEKWRDERNQMKDAVSFHTRGPQRDLGIGFMARNSTTRILELHVVRLGDVAEGLRLSARLTSAVVSLGRTRTVHSSMHAPAVESVD
jgi:hypothetical protein